MAGADGHNRNPAERAWAQRQQMAAVERDRERYREAWRDQMQTRRQVGPIVGFACFIAFAVGTLLLARYGAIVWIIGALLMAACIAYGIRPGATGYFHAKQGEAAWRKSLT